MTTYYVSPSGNDSNSGLSLGAAWRTIGHAAGIVAAGDTVNVAPGTYAETVTLTANGTALAPITFVSTTRWGALITNPAAALASVNLQGAYTIFDGFEVVNPTNQFGIDFESGADGCVVRHCHVHTVATSVVTTGSGIGCVLSGITVPITIDSNTIHDVGFAGNGNNQHGMYLSANFSAGPGNAKVTNNLIYSFLSGSGIQLWGDPQHYDVVNNTIFNCSSEGVVLGATTGHTLANNRILNNIFVDCNMPAATVAGGGTYGTGNLIEYNCDYHCTNGYIQVDSSFTVSSNLRNLNPLLINYQADGSGDYHLLSASMLTLTPSGTSVADATLTTACVMAAGSGGTETSTTTTTTGSNTVAEIESKGNAGSAGVAAIPATPTGKGWLFRPGPATLASGNWSASVTILPHSWSGSSTTTTLTLRAFLYSSGTYTPIGVWVPVGVTGLTKTTYSFPSTSFPAVTLATGDALYFDLWWTDTASINTDNPAVYVSSSVAGGVAGDLQITLPAFAATSPAIGAGTATGAPSTDYDGNARPYGSSYDIGAYEWPQTRTTYARVQGTTGSTGGSDASACTVTSLPTGSGHLLVAFVNIQGTASVTITPPAGWSQAGTAQGYLTGSGTVALFYRPNSTGGVTTFTFGFSASCNAAIAFEEWSGVASASPLDTSVAHQEGKAAAVTTATTGALTGAGELALWGLGVGGAGTLSYSAITNGYSKGASAHSTQSIESQATLFNNTSVGPGATSSGCTMSSTGATDHTTILAVFLPSGTGGSGVPLAATLAGRGQLAATTLGQDIGVTTIMTGANPYGEIMSEGSAGTAGVAALPATPTGHGWVYGPGAGRVAPGDWQAEITISAADWGGDATSTTLTFRAFLYSGGVYTPIGVWAPMGVTATAKTTYAFSATSFNSVTTGPDDLLYFDLWWRDTNSSIAGDNPTVYVSTAGKAGDMQVGLPLFTPAVVVPPPAGGPLSLTIGGQGAQVVGGSLTAKAMVGRRGELSATVFDEAGATHLQQSQQVALYDATSALAFSGYITSPVETKPGLGPLLVTQFTATDQHYLAAKRIAAVVYRNQTTGFMVNDLWTNILAMEGVTIGQIDPGITIPVVNFGYVPVSDALDALAVAASSAGVPHYWMIDQDKALWFVAYASVTGPTIDGTQIDGDGTRSGVVPSVTRANPLYRNTQYAVGGTQQTSTNDETRAGDGQTRTFPFSYALNDTPSLFTLNGTAKSLGVKGQSGFNYYYAVGDNTIVQDSSQTILVSTDRLRMVYIGQVPAVFTAQNTAAVAQQAMLDNTSGIVESVVTDTTIASLAEGTTVVGQLLTRYCLPGARFVFATQASGFAPGQLSTVDYPPLDFAGAQLLIEEVDLSDQQDGFQIWYTVTAVQGPYDTTWAEFFGNLGKPPAYNIAANISLGTVLNSPLLPSTSLFPSLTLYPQD